MSTNKPFGRSLALIAAINDIFSSMGRNLKTQQMVQVLASSGQYQSRGHGRNKRSGANVKVLNKMRKCSDGAYPKYVPYGGAKEIARRAVRFGDRAFAGRVTWVGDEVSAFPAR